MNTFTDNKKFKNDTLLRLYNITKFKYCSKIELGALVEMEQIHLDGSIKPAAWVSDDNIKYVAFGNQDKVFFFDKQKLIKISKTKQIKLYEKTKTKGFYLTLHEIETFSNFNF